ncbi:MAG: heavy-metal-associated domain-containing protein [Bacteroidetes bacterium]|nr:heavy-metal-associated domain-containing protein [Bacteroidota bacterium]
MKTEIIKIQNMKCGGCENNVKNAINDLPGIIDVKTDISASTVTIIYNGDENLLPVFRQVLEEAGYPEK